MDDIFLQMSYTGDLLKQIFIWHVDEFLSNWLKHFSGGLLHVIVKHLSVLVKDHLVSCPIELLIRQLGSLLSINHLDGIFHSVPILQGLVPVQVIISISQIIHSTTIIVVHIWAASRSLHIYFKI